MAKICHVENGVVFDDMIDKKEGGDFKRPIHTVYDAETEYPICDERDIVPHDLKIGHRGPLPKSIFSAFKVILAGAPAAGKGTQCEIIKSSFGLVHLSTGDILRKAVQQETALGMIAKPYMDGGHLVPDDLVIELILDRLREHDCETRGWLLDGFPRTKSQADALKNSGILPDVFLLLDVPEDILVERVTGRRTDPTTGKIYHMTFNPPESEEVASRLVQRSDDTAEKVTIRYKEFQSHIDAIKSSYVDRMVRIDGTVGQDEVSKSVISELDLAIIKKREGLAGHDRSTSDVPVEIIKEISNEMPSLLTVVEEPIDVPVSA